MEEEKAAAYYEELTRKGEGAARFKQGLGFTSNSSSETTTANRGSALPSSSSFLSKFVRASSPAKPSDEFDKHVQLENIQNKLKKKQSSSEKENHSRVSDIRSRDDGSRHRSSSRERDRDRYRSSRMSRSRSRDGYDSRRRIRHHRRSPSRERDEKRDRDRGRSERSRRSRSRSCSDGEVRHPGRSSRERHGKGMSSRSLSPRDRKLEKSEGDRLTARRRDHKEKKNGGVDYSSLIKGYQEMTPAERVKAKMKVQLSQTVEKDTLKGMGAGWERFEFNKDAPLDDEEIEAAEDDAVLVKNMGQSFRFSAVEARREEQIQAIHDEAMFGTPAVQASIVPDKELIIESNEMTDNDKKESDENGLSSNLVSDKVLAKQQGSWRDRARKLQDGSKS